MKHVTIPTSAPADVQQAFRDVQSQIDVILGGMSIDLSGRRIINAGDGIEQSDYATMRQLPVLTPTPTGAPSDVTDLTVRGRARFLGTVQLPKFSDGSKHHLILFVDEAGLLAGSSDGAGAFDYNAADVLLELGYGMRIKWIAHLASIGCPTDGVINFLNDTLDDFSRLVLGTDDVNGVALVKNVSHLELRTGGVGGAFLSPKTADVLAGAANTYNLGDSGSPWANAYVGNIISGSTNPLAAPNVSTGAGTVAVFDGSGNLLKQSSSRRYKDRMVPAKFSHAERRAFLAVDPHWWDYTHGETGALGLLAEDLAAAPIVNAYGRSPFVNYDGQGLPESNRDYALLGMHHLLLRDYETRIAALEARVKALEASV